jgi:C4-dicarboxylate transporter, DctM subunit
MSPLEVGIIAIVAMIVLMFLGMWIGMAMAIVGFTAYTYLGGFQSAFTTLSTLPYNTVADYNITAVPLFVFMGALVSTTGVSTDLYNTAYTWLGSLRGGLAVATVAACTAFAAICGSSTASAITMGKVCLPEMKKHNYDDRLATGVVASGGTLGILIPPSLGFILYGIITENSVGALFMAGIIPGIMLAVMFMVVVVLWCLRDRSAGPPGPKTTLKQKVVSLKGTWMMVVLFVVVLGGIYFGIFTPTESGAVGTLGAIIITAVTRRLSLKHVVNSAKETGQTTAMVLFIMIGAYIFMRVLAVSQLPVALANFVSSLTLSRYAIYAVIIILYIILGMFLEIMSAIVFTVPIIYPMIINLGFDPIWFGVIMVIMMEMGFITPPVGLNVFVLGSVTDTPMNRIFAGVYPFAVTMLICVVLLTIFPQIATFLPHNM